MKIDIHVQHDFSALVVPSGCDLTKLPDDVRQMADRPSGWVKERSDTAAHIIALDTETACDEITRKGYYINRFKKDSPFGNDS